MTDTADIQKNKYSILYAEPLFSKILNVIDELNRSKHSTKVCDVYRSMIEAEQKVEPVLFARTLEILCDDGKLAFDIERNQLFINDILRYSPEKFLLLKRKYGSLGQSGIVAHPSHYSGLTERMEQHIYALECGRAVDVEFLEKTLFSNPAVLADERFYERPKEISRMPRIDFEKIIRDCAK